MPAAGCASGHAGAALAARAEAGMASQHLARGMRSGSSVSSRGVRPGSAARAACSAACRALRTSAHVAARRVLRRRRRFHGAGRRGPPQSGAAELFDHPAAAATRAALRLALVAARAACARGRLRRLLEAHGFCYRRRSGSRWRSWCQCGSQRQWQWPSRWRWRCRCRCRCWPAPRSPTVAASAFGARQAPARCGRCAWHSRAA